MKSLFLTLQTDPRKERMFMIATDMISKRIIQDGPLEPKKYGNTYKWNKTGDVNYELF
jgi:hypothetical protein